MAFLPHSHFCCSCVCVFVCLADILYWVSVCLEEALSWPKYWQSKPEIEAGVWRLTIRLGSDLSSHADKESHLHSLSLAQWYTEKRRHVTALWYMCSHYVTSLPLSQCFFSSFFFFFLRVRKNKTNRRNKTLHADWQLQHREIFFEVLLFEILEGSLPVWLRVSLMGSVKSARPWRPSGISLFCLRFIFCFCTAVVIPDILAHNSRLFVTHPDTTSATLRPR